MILTRTTNRRGFTILELLLATVCATLLLTALYYSFDLTIEQTQAARDASGTEDLIRGVINRMSIDISASLGPLPPNSGGLSSVQTNSASLNGASSSSSSGTSSGSASGGTSSAGSSTGAAIVGGNAVAGKAQMGSVVSGSGMSGGSSSGGSSSSSTPILGSGQNVPFEAGVVGGYNGNNNMLVLFISRVPDMFTTTDQTSLAQTYGTQSGTSSSSTTQYPADLRRVVYWLGSSGKGLYRQETPWVTGDMTWNLSDLPLSDDQGTLIAEEVTQFDLQYYDPLQGWVQNWDGTGGTSPPQSLTPGPPAAIQITFTFEFGNPKGSKPIQTTIQQTFPILTATGQITQSLLDPTASGSTSGSGGSSGSTTGGQSVGGKATGGQAVGGKATGGQATGGKATGGSVVGGK